MKSKDPADSTAALTERIAVLEALCLALDRRREVFELLEAATDPNGALLGLQDVFDLDAVVSCAVMDLQLRRLTGNERELPKCTAQRC